jgi:hypothetical protein
MSGKFNSLWQIEFFAKLLNKQKPVFHLTIKTCLSGYPNSDSPDAFPSIQIKTIKQKVVLPTYRGPPEKHTF